jgi:hypothetical protein
LPDNAKAFAKIPGRAHRRIGREGMANLGERMIERKIVRYHLGRHAAKPKPLSSLLSVNAVRANRSRITVSAFFPMEDLSGIERARQIEIGRRDFSP